MNIYGQMSDGVESVDGRFLCLGPLSGVSLESGLILEIFFSSFLPCLSLLLCFFFLDNLRVHNHALLPICMC